MTHLYQISIQYRDKPDMHSNFPECAEADETFYNLCKQFEIAHFEGGSGFGFRDQACTCRSRPPSSFVQTIKTALEPLCNLHSVDIVERDEKDFDPSDEDLENPDYEPYQKSLDSWQSDAYKKYINSDYRNTSGFGH